MYGFKLLLDSNYRLSSERHLQYVEQLVSEGLRKGELRTFLADSPDKRRAVVEELVRNNATKERFHAQMRLSMLRYRANGTQTNAIMKSGEPIVGLWNR